MKVSGKRPKRPVLKEQLVNILVSVFFEVIIIIGVIIIIMAQSHWLQPFKPYCYQLLHHTSQNEAVVKEQENNSIPRYGCEHQQTNCKDAGERKG